MIENAVGTLDLPLGLAPGFIINGQQYVVPFCVEEPSVVAACCNIAKRVAKHGGFTSTATSNVMTTSVQVLDIPDIDRAVGAISDNSDTLIKDANDYLKSQNSQLFANGGGVVGVEPEVLRPQDGRAPYLSVNMAVNVGNSMGANRLNSIAEHMASSIAHLTQGRVNLRILSNLCVHRRAASMFMLPVDSLAQHGLTGAEVAKGVMEAYYYAADSPYRATTHNKGVKWGGRGRHSAGAGLAVHRGEQPCVRCALWALHADDNVCD